MQRELITLPVTWETYTDAVKNYVPFTTMYKSPNGYCYQCNGTVVFYKRIDKGMFHVVMCDLQEYIGFQQYQRMFKEDLKTFLNNHVLDFAR